MIHETRRLMLHILTPILLTNIFQINTRAYGRKILETHFDCYFAVLVPPCQKKTNLTGKNARMVAKGTYLSSGNLKQRPDG